MTTEEIAAAEAWAQRLPLHGTTSSHYILALAAALREERAKVAKEVDLNCTLTRALDEIAAVVDAVRWKHPGEVATATKKRIADRETACERKDALLAAIADAPESHRIWIGLEMEGGLLDVLCRLEVGKR